MKKKNTKAITREFDTESFSPSHKGYGTLKNFMRSMMVLECPLHLSVQGSSYQELRNHLLNEKHTIDTWGRAPILWPDEERDYTVGLLDRMYRWTHHSKKMQDDDIEYLIIKMDVPLQVLKDTLLTNDYSLENML